MRQIPKYKESPGKITLQTPFQDEFQRWLCYELENSKQWNPNQITGGMQGVRRWEYRSSRWVIRWEGGPVIVKCDEPRVWIRKGLVIVMGQSRLEMSS